jgi:phosphoribosylformylglycinamidine (FGAM) synthase PurS component
MKTLKGYFYINSGYVNATKKEEFEVEIHDGNSEESILQDMFNDFLGNTDMGWVIEEEITN